MTNGEERNRQAHRARLLEILRRVLAALDGRVRVSDYLKRARWSPEKVALIAVGKAAPSMAQGAHDVLGKRIFRGLVIAKAVPDFVTPPGWEIRCGAHPVPDVRSLRAGRALLRFIADLPREIPLLFLTSGGASALVEVLPAGVELADVQRCNSWLLGADLDIRCMNRIRSRMSLIKGGGLLDYIDGRSVLNLLISDVPGDDIGTIGSGLLYSPRRLAQDGLSDPGVPEWLHSLLNRIPPRDRRRAAGAGEVRYEIIASTGDARQAAAASGRRLGYDVRLHSTLVTGNALAVGSQCMSEIKRCPGKLQIWSGETTVRLPEHPGTGGRNQSLALAAALEAHDSGPLILLAAATDGDDADSGAAGAIVDEHTVDRGRQSGLSAQQCLEQADAGTFLAASGDLITTAPSRTNVMDLMLGLNYGGPPSVT